MREGVRLGRVAGVQLSAHWSLAVVVVVVAAALDRGILPAFSPGLGGGWYASAALVTSVAFVVTIVAHEIGHAVVAGRQGLPVHGVVIWALGGVTNIGGEAATPRDELALSGVGPAVSLVLGGGLVGLGLAARAAGSPPLLAGALAWLGALNILLAVLNALPASPLDGGRMLHAGLWRLLHDRARATAVTTRIGQVAGASTTIAGLYLMVAAGTLEGLWIAATGGFVLYGATAERRQAVMVAAIGDRAVATLMSPVAPTAVPGWWTVAQVLAEGAGLRSWPLAVVADWGGATTGLVAVGVLRAVPAAQQAVVCVEDLAVPAWSVVVSNPEEPLVELLRRWPDSARWAVAVDRGRAVGALGVRELDALMVASRRRPGRTASTRSDVPVACQGWTKA